MKTCSVLVRATLAAVVSFATHTANAVQTTEVSDYSGSTSPTYSHSLAALASEPAQWTTTSGLTSGDVGYDVGVCNREFGMQNRDYGMQNREWRMHNRDYGMHNRDFGL